MATVMDSNCLEQIGQTAGDVWHVLHENGPLSVAKLVKSVDAPREIVQQAIGWLAREGKISIEEEGRSRIVSLAE